MREVIPVQFSSVTQACPTLCNTMNRSTPGLPVHHQLPEFTQTHVHWVGDAIQPPHPLFSLSPPAFSLSQDQDLFQWVSSSHRWPSIGALASVLLVNIQGWFPLGLTSLNSLLSKGLSGVFSSTTVWKPSSDNHLPFCIFLFLGNGLHHTLLYNITNLHS